MPQACCCRECHGKDLRGRKPDPNGPPSGPDIVTIAHNNTLAAFDGGVRKGMSTTGRPLAETMPWKSYAQLEDIEVAALYAYLRSL